jgi:hypothetical protein
MLIINGLDGVISQKTELFTTTAMRASNPIRLEIGLNEIIV